MKIKFNPNLGFQREAIDYVVDMSCPPRIGPGIMLE